MGAITHAPAIGRARAAIASTPATGRGDTSQTNADRAREGRGDAMPDSADGPSPRPRARTLPGPCPI